ncbi:MAG: ERF family protein [Verrucomicrobiota bacterium]
MKTSDSITAIAAAVHAVQSVGLTAVAKAKNSQTNSKYAKLSEIILTVIPEITRNGMALMQPLGPCRTEGGKTFRSITTRLQHSSGEFMAAAAEFELPAPPKSGQGKDILNASQTDGVVITYGRRYALLSFLGIATGDDDDAQKLEDKLHSGAPEVSFKESPPWHALAGNLWQAEEAPCHPGKAIDELSPPEYSAMRRDHWRDSAAVCASLWDDVQTILWGMDLTYESAPKPGRGWPDDWRECSHAQVRDLYAWAKTQEKAREGAPS